MALKNILGLGCLVTRAPDFWDCFGREILSSYNRRNTVSCADMQAIRDFTALAFIMHVTISGIRFV